MHLYLMKLQRTVQIFYKYIIYSNNNNWYIVFIKIMGDFGLLKWIKSFYYLQT